MIRTTLFAFVVSASAGFALAADYSSLLNNSPFAPLGPGAAAGGDKSVEFRGLYTDPEKGSTFFSLYDTATQRSAWVGMNETGHPFVVRSYNAANDTVTVELNGHNVNVALKHAAVQLVAATKQPAPAAANQPSDNGQRGGRWMQNVMGADGRPDPKRMEAFVEEMRRRRAQRMQAFGPQNPGEGGTGAATPGAAGAAQNAPGQGAMPMPAPGRAGEGGSIPMPTPGAGPGAVPMDLNNPNR